MSVSEGDLRRPLSVLRVPLHGGAESLFQGRVRCPAEKPASLSDIRPRRGHIRAMYRPVLEARRTSHGSFQQRDQVAHRHGAVPTDVHDFMSGETEGANGRLGSVVYVGKVTLLAGIPVHDEGFP